MSTLPTYCTDEAHRPATMRGCAAEWSAALDLLAAAHEGRSGVLLVEGEPGIGKSLLWEVTRTARASGFSSVTAGTPALGRMPFPRLSLADTFQGGRPGKLDRLRRVARETIKAQYGPFQRRDDDVRGFSG